MAQFIANCRAGAPLARQAPAAVLDTPREFRSISRGVIPHEDDARRTQWPTPESTHTGPQEICLQPALLSFDEWERSSVVEKAPASARVSFATKPIATAFSRPGIARSGTVAAASQTSIAEPGTAIADMRTAIADMRNAIASSRTAVAPMRKATDSGRTGVSFARNRTRPAPESRPIDTFMTTAANTTHP